MSDHNEHLFKEINRLSEVAHDWVNSLESALTRLRSENKIMREALTFYADEHQYSREAADPCSAACCGITDEGGKRARQALGEMKK